MSDREIMDSKFMSLKTNKTNNNNNMKYIKFEASWCGACKMLTPILRKVSEAGIPVESIDTEHNAELVTHYNVRNLPTVILVNSGGYQLARFTGTKEKAEDYIITYQKHANG